MHVLKVYCGSTFCKQLLLNVPFSTTITCYMFRNTVASQWRNARLVFVRQLQRWKEIASAAYKWLSSKVNAMNIGLSLKCNSDAGWSHKHEPMPGEVSTVIQIHSNQSACDRTSNFALGESGLLWQCSLWKPQFSPCHWTPENSSYIFIMCLHKSTFCS